MHEKTIFSRFLPPREQTWDSGQLVENGQDSEASRHASEISVKSSPTLAPTSSQWLPMTPIAQLLLLFYFPLLEKPRGNGKRREADGQSDERPREMRRVPANFTIAPMEDGVLWRRLRKPLHSYWESRHCARHKLVREVSEKLEEIGGRARKDCPLDWWPSITAWWSDENQRINYRIFSSWIWSIHF